MHSFKKKAAVKIYIISILHMFSTSVSAQLIFQPDANGEGLIHQIPGLAFNEYIITKKCVKQTQYILSPVTHSVFCAEGPVDIVSVVYKVINHHDILYILLSDGSVQGYDITTKTKLQKSNLPDPISDPAAQIIGDDLYVRKSKTVYKSSDNNITWIIDTVGLQGAFLNSINVDTSQNVYLATSKGLFTQSLTGNTWTKNINFPPSSCNLVYTDRTNRLFVATTNRLYLSLDLGASFQLDTAGIGTQKVLSLGDDVYGNIYAVVNSSGSSNGGNRIYRSKNGNPFVRIDQSLSTLNEDSLVVNPFNQVSGDSVLLASTAFGLFTSRNKGDAWKESNTGINAESYFGLTQTNNKLLIATTQLGCFSTTNNADTAWKKIYPVYGYSGGQPVFRDAAGVLYTAGGTLFKDLNSQTRLIIKSTNNGKTWNADTAGISQIHMFNWFVDETGVQHGAQFGNGTASIKLFKKNAGQSWVTDMAGYSSSNFAQPIAFGSNGNGKTYFSQSGNLLWSKQGTGNWIIDTTGLNDAIYDFAFNSNHTEYLGGYNGVWKQSGNSWIKLNNPSSTTGNGLHAFAITVDSNNTVWAAFSYFNESFKAIGEGIFYTKDDGATWKKLQPDTITFRKLITIDKKVYGISYFNGIYEFKAKPNQLSEFIVTKINEHSIKLKPQIKIEPNPVIDHQFNIQLNSFDKGYYVINLINNLGQEIIAKKIIHYGGSSSYTVNLPLNIIKGCYYVQVANESSEVGRKLIIQ